MITVMHICSDSVAGGATKMLLTLLSHVDKQEFRHVALIPPSNPYFGDFSRLGIETLPLNSTSDRSLSLGAVLECVKIIKRTRPDIVHTHGASFGRIAGRLCGIGSLIYTRHTYTDKRVSVIKKAINRFITTKAVAVSSALLEQVYGSGMDPQKVVLIENGCDEIARDESFYNGDIVLLYLGRLVKEKGIDLAIDATRKLRSLSQPCSLVIAGDGPYRREIENRISIEELSQYVHLTGHQKDVTRLIQKCRILLNCSYENEATSNSVIEALSAGVPVCASKVAGNCYIIKSGENGMLYESGSSDDLVKAVITVSENYSSYSKNAKKTYFERFTANSMALKYEALWKDEYESNRERKH